MAGSRGSSTKLLKSQTEASQEQESSKQEEPHSRGKLSLFSKGKPYSRIVPSASKTEPGSPQPFQTGAGELLEELSLAEKGA
mmetsp:Transcript_2012/g.3213  ORF Transcript_2012/g.3213 Transcript_2012/m.3213 type:complete len:82 (+) Transcript_2012:535-780(+)